MRNPRRSLEAIYACTRWSPGWKLDSTETSNPSPTAQCFSPRGSHMKCFQFIATTKRLHSEGLPSIAGCTRQWLARLDLNGTGSIENLKSGQFGRCYHTESSDSNASYAMVRQRRTLIDKQLYVKNPMTKQPPTTTPQAPDELQTSVKRRAYIQPTLMTLQVPELWKDDIAKEFQEDERDQQQKR